MPNSNEKNDQEKQMNLPGTEYLPLAPVHVTYEHTEHPFCQFCAKPLACGNVCGACSLGW